MMKLPSLPIRPLAFRAVQLAGLVLAVRVLWQPLSQLAGQALGFLALEFDNLVFPPRWGYLTISGPTFDGTERIPGRIFRKDRGFQILGFHANGLQAGERWIPIGRVLQIDPVADDDNHALAELQSAMVKAWGEAKIQEQGARSASKANGAASSIPRPTPITSTGA